LINQEQLEVFNRNFLEFIKENKWEGSYNEHSCTLW
jgi:hypothetical protein